MPVDFTSLGKALQDRYRLERELGAGGMATVYLAEDLKHHRQVAIKVLRPELAAVLGAERFLKEIETTATLQHPHILPLFDSGQADSFLYYVMPYVEGQSLRERLARDGELPVAEAVRIARAVASAVGAAHRRGIVHRDIKPENILLADGEPVVADFGIARAISASAGDRLTSTGLAVGTPAYMSPEQASADSRIDGRTDLYSLGAVLYEMLAGEQPFRGRTAEAITARKMTEDAPALHGVRPAVPEALDLVVRKALARTAGDRFQTAEEFIGALDQVALSESGATRRVAATPPSRAARLVMPLAAVTVASLAFASWALLRPLPPQPVIRHLSAQAEGEGILAWGGLAISPDGSRLVYRGPPDSAPQLWLRNRSELHATPIPGTVGGFNPVFSPDGGQLAYQAGVGVRVARLDGSPPVTLVSTVWSSGLAWSDDGYIYYSALPGISRVSPTGGPAELVFPIDSTGGEGIQHLPSALPGGRGLLFTSHHPGDSLFNEIVLGIPSTGERKMLAKGLVGRYAASGHLLIVTEEGVLVAAPFDLRRLTVTGPTVQLFGDVGTDLAVSRSGTVVYTLRGSADALTGIPVWVERGGRETPVEPDWAVAVSSGFALSPDGSTLALSIDPAPGGKRWSDIWLKKLRGGALSRLTSHPTIGALQPFWSPDGKMVGYTKWGTARPGLWQKAADGSGREDSLLTLSGKNVWSGSWSADGRWLLGSAIGVGLENDIVAIRPGLDSAPVAVVHSKFDEQAPLLSPDGRWLAYSSNESGRREVYVRPFPVADGGKWQISLEGGEHPRWGPRGTDLYYVVHGKDDFFGASGDIMLASLRTSTDLEVISRSVFAPAPEGGAKYLWDYDVHPDGKRLLMMRLLPEQAEERPQLMVVENFFEELKAKVPR